MNKPIGHLVKQVDVLLTNGIDDIQQAFGLTRTGWQVIHTLSTTGDIDRTELSSVMLPFVDEEGLQTLLQQLIWEGVIGPPADNKVVLTEKGKHLHQQCFEAQIRFRKTLMHDISEQEYTITIQTLERMIANLL